MGLFPFRVSVVNVETVAHARPLASPLKHLQIAVRIAERCDRTSSDCRLDGERLGRPIVIKAELRETLSNDALETTDFYERQGLIRTLVD
jgi:hypothetical protein